MRRLTVLITNFLGIHGHRDRRPRFGSGPQALQNFLRTKGGTLVYYVIDLLALDGKDLRSEPRRVTFCVHAAIWMPGCLLAGPGG